MRQEGAAEWIDISWTECVTHTSPLSEFRGAARLAVKAHTQAFCDSAFAAAESGVILCPITGDEVTRSTAHIDHDDPWPFAKIVDIFLEREGIDLEQVSYDGFEHGSTYVTFADSKLARRFVTFHDKVAKLRVLSSKGNLRRGGD